MINKVILVGNLGNDPDVRTTAGGVKVANFQVATSEKWTDKDGEKKERTEWHRIVCFGRTAENVDSYLTKGRQVYIEGRLQTRKWQDKNGNDRWSTEVVADTVRFLGSNPSKSEKDEGFSGQGEDDIPF